MPDEGEAPLHVVATVRVVTEQTGEPSVAVDWGDASTDFQGTGATVLTSHDYEGEGTYNVQVSARMPGGDEATDGAVVVAYPPGEGPAVEPGAPDPTLSASPTLGMVPLTVSFAASAEDGDGDISGWVLDFGDGTEPVTSGGATAAASARQSLPLDMDHTYTQVGTYTALLSVSDAAGHEGADSVQISAGSTDNSPPRCTLAASPLSGPAPLTVTVTGTGIDTDGTIEHYLLDFGDGTAAYDSPSAPSGLSHVYTEPGIKTAKLTVTDNEGATGSIRRGIYVSGVGAVTVGPASLDFGETDTSLTLTLTCSDQTTTWSGLASQDWLALDPANGSGDATVTVTADRAALAEGTYTATITFAADGDTVSVPVSLTVAAGSTTISVTPPSLDFGLSVTEETLAIAFSGGQAVDWSCSVDQSWVALSQTAGSGDSTLTVSVDRTGLAAGDYSATIAVTSDVGDATVPVTMSVDNPPEIASLVAEPDKVFVNESSTITATASDPDSDPVTYTWAASGGVLSGSGSQVTWTAPATTGAYTVTCTVDDGLGLSVSASVDVLVGEPGGFDVIVSGVRGR